MDYFFKNVHRVIKFNRNALLKPYFEMSADLRKNVKRIWNNYGKCKKT